jgi:alpha-L-fucosidase
VLRPLICLLLAGLLIAPAAGAESPEEKAARLRWFQDAKLGIFIHWGIYAVDGIDESWSFHNGKVSHEQYMRQLQGFTAANYDPAAWARLIKLSGARYAVLTAKHHDGVALWDTREDHLSVVRDTPAGRDLIGPYCRALRSEGLKVGLYYSLIDWSHHHYPNFLRDRKRYAGDEARWARFTRFNFAQIRELGAGFRPDLVWFDGDWEFSAEDWRAAEIRDLLLTQNPEVIINSRLQGHGDYGTPEQGVPIKRPDFETWELCLTMNDSWGYQPRDTNYKTANQIIRILVECLSLGGNLLLDIGPRADGTICPEQTALLEQLGRWTAKHAEAVYGTRPGLPAGYFHGPTALSPDRRTLYLYLAHRPVGPLMLKGIVSTIEKVEVVGQASPLPWDIKMKLSWSDRPGIVYITVPEEMVDPEVTVIAVHLDGPLELFAD